MTGFDPISTAIGASAAGLSSLMKLVQGFKQRKLANQIHPQDVTYQVSPYAKANLGMYQQLYNARMPGAAQLENNIYGNQANTLAGVNRNATNSSQALAIAAGVQGQTDQSFQQLAIQEAQNKQAMAGQLAGANQALVTEGDKVYNDQLRKYQEDVAAKTALRSSSLNNIYSGIGNLGEAGMAFGGAMGGMKGGGGSLPVGASQPNFASMPQQPINTGNIPLPQQGSVRAPYFNPLTGQWQFN